MSKDTPVDKTDDVNTPPEEKDLKTKDPKTAAVVEESQEAVTTTIKAPPATSVQVAIAPSPDDELPKLPRPKSPEWWQTWLLGLYLVTLFVLLGYLLLKLWANEVDGARILLFYGLYNPTIHADTRLLAIVMVSGALGSFFHAAKSFVAFVGNRTIYINWFWWYFLRPLSGMVLGTIFYFLLRGGLLPGQGDENKISTYGVAALAGLAGMFADRASLKLEEIFDTLFKADDRRKDKLDEAAKADAVGKLKPAIKSLKPEEVKAAQDVVMVVTGTGFVTESTVTLAGKKVKSTVVNSTEMKVEIKASEIPSVGTFDLIVVNPKPGGPSDPAKLKVIA